MFSYSFSCSVALGFVLLMFCCVTSQAGEPDKKKLPIFPQGSIDVRLQGMLSVLTADKSAVEPQQKVIFAGVRAGGTQIVLDWKDCPVIAKELSEYHNSMGGGFVSYVRAEVTGKMTFQPKKIWKSSIGLGKQISLVESGEKLVPVVIVKTIQISILPMNELRKRKRITSTTTGLKQKKEMMSCECMVYDYRITNSIVSTKLQLFETLECDATMIFRLPNSGEFGYRKNDD